MCQHSNHEDGMYVPPTQPLQMVCSFNVHADSMAEVHISSEPSQCVLMPFTQTKSDKLLDDQDMMDEKQLCW